VSGAKLPLLSQSRSTTKSTDIATEASERSVSATVRAVRGSTYHVAAIFFATLQYLCIHLLKAGYDPEASVECYLEGATDWDVRAKTIRACAAAEHMIDEDSLRTTPTPRKRRIGDSSAVPSSARHTQGRVYCAEASRWCGLRLRLRSSNRDLAVIKRRDAKYCDRFRVDLAPDHLSDILNLARTKEAAVALALTMLRHKAATKRALSAHRRKAAGRIS
jgi:hypothetical protein